MAWLPLCGIVLALVVNAAAATFTTFDAPGSVYTIAGSINAGGAITGYYHGADNVTHAYVRSSDGITFTTIDPPGSTYTLALSINVAGAVVGSFTYNITNPNPTYHGYIASGGSYTPFDPPGVGASGTSPISINSAGTITGYYEDANYVDHGFVRAADGTITTFEPRDPLSCGFPPNVCGVVPLGINDGGAITGYYNLSHDSPVYHGFLRAATGTFTTFDPPGSVHTTARGINLAGAITGYYQDSNNVTHSFLRDSGGAFTTFDPPGSVSTSAVSINDAGAITGVYQDANQIYHGFVRAADGTITTFDPPGSVSTFSSSINDEGTITGVYQDANQIYHGFVRVGDSDLITKVTVSAATGTYGGPVNLTATLTKASGGGGISGQTISFTLNGSSVGSAGPTDANGVATMTGLSLSGINAGTYPGYVGATFTADNGYGGSSGSNSLTVNPLAVTLTGGSYSAAYDGSTHALSACTSSAPAFITCNNSPAGPVGPDVGSSYVTPTPNYLQGNAGDYTLTSNNGNWSIGKLTVNLTAGSLTGTYNGNAQSPSACSSDQPTFVSCPNSPSSVGPDVGSGTVNVAALTVANYLKGNSGDYTINTMPGSWSIGKVTVNLTAGSLAGTYNGSAQSPSACTSDHPGFVTCANNPSLVGPNAGSGAVSLAPNYLLGNSGDYTISTTPGSWSIVKILPTVTFTGAPPSAAYQSSFTVTAATNASTTATITAIPAGVCTIAGNIVTMTSGTGTCSLTANWPADTNYLAASATRSTTASKIAPRVTLSLVNGSFLTTPLGLNPGDQYQLLFVTAGSFQPTSTNIADYNADVAAEAALNPALAAFDAQNGVTWSAIASTPSVVANVNAPSIANVYTLNGALVATASPGLYSDALLSTPTADQYGQFRTYHGNPPNSNGTWVWTGNYLGGGRLSGNTLASTNPSFGFTNYIDRRWEFYADASYFGNPPGTPPNPLPSFPLYALSSKITVPVGGSSGVLYESNLTVEATTNASTSPTITASGACTIAGNTVTITGATGTCSLTATWVADSNYLAASASQSTTVMSPQTAIKNVIISAVNNLASQGVLSQGNGQGSGSSLVTKLNGAIDALTNGDSNSASGKLNAFINEVNALVTSRKLSSSQGQALIGPANSVLSQMFQPLPLTFSLSYRYPSPVGYGYSTLIILVKNTSSVAATNVTITSIGGITSPAATFDYWSPPVPFVLPASVAPGVAYPFTLTFQVPSGNPEAPFSFVITAEADNVAPFMTTINVP